MLPRVRMRRYAIYFLAWTAAGLFYSTQDFIPRLYRNETVPWYSVFVGWMAAMYICAVFTPAMLWLGTRWPLEGSRGWWNALLHTGFSAVFSVIVIAIEAPVVVMLKTLPAIGGTRSFSTMFPMLLVYSFHGNVIRYWVVLGLQAAYRSHQKARQREQEALHFQVHSSQLAGQLSAAQLRALKTQLQPHFLFNTLGAIVALVRQKDSQQAETMLCGLSDLLRLSLEDVEEREVPLWRELEFLRLYLSIEQVRFQDRLCVQISADPEISDALVPHMSLQPLVENAVRHGLGQSEEPVLIHVEARRLESSLVITVSDDGPGSPTGFEGKGIGLANTRDRLRCLYGAQSTLHAESLTPHGVKIAITLPYHTDAMEQECV